MPSLPTGAESKILQKKKKHVSDMFLNYFFFIIIVFAHIRKHLPAISLCLFCIICAYVFAL